MNSPGSRRLSLAEWYRSQPLSAWETQFERDTAVEKRYRALLAILALATPEQQIARLPAWLKDRDGEIRAAAAHWLMTACQRQTLPLSQLREHSELLTVLGEMLQDSDPDGQLAAVRALSWLEPADGRLLPAVEELWRRDDSHSGSQAALADVCGRVAIIGLACLEFLKPLLSSEQAEVREAAASAFGANSQLAQGAVPELQAALDDEEPVVREQAAVALGGCGPLPEATVAALRTAARDEDAGVATAAQLALTKLGVPFLADSH